MAGHTTGKLYHDGALLCDVVYGLTVQQELLQGRPGDQPVPGIKRIEGVVSSTKQCGVIETVMLSGAAVTLRLKDGRRFDCFVSDSRGRIVSRSGVGLYLPNDSE
jgi:hypothetical protein